MMLNIRLFCMVEPLQKVNLSAFSMIIEQYTSTFTENKVITYLKTNLNESKRLT